MNHGTRSAVRLFGVFGWACVAMFAGAPEAMAAPDEIVLRVRRIVSPHMTKAQIDPFCGEVNRIWAARIHALWSRRASPAVVAPMQ